MRRFSSMMLFLIFSISSIFAELMSSQKFGYTIDFPEGFVMIDGTEDESMFQFGSEIVPVQVLITTTSSVKSADEFLRTNLKKLGATLKGGQVEQVVWRRKNVPFASFTMQNQIFNEQQQGIAVSVPLLSQVGSKSQSFVSLIVFTPKKNFYQYECFVSSIVDSLVIDVGSFKEPGIVTSKKYKIDEKNTIPVELLISGEKIFTKINKVDEIANQSVIDREFNVFKVYALSNNPKIAQFAIPAWQRFYRMIARDCLGRLKRVAFDVNSALQNVAFEKDSKNPDAVVAQLLLNWVQEFEYQRASSDAAKADFNNIAAVLQNKGSDCDSRSMLIAVLLKNMGMDSCIFVSSAYSHALLGVVLDGKEGQSIEIDKKKYLLGDTTVKGLTFGTIAAEQADRSKWVEIEFPF